MARTFLRGATIIDGVADAGYPGSVLVDGDVIGAVGAGLVPADGDEVIDCQGLFICPGFIDSHCHLIYNDAKDLYDLEIAKSIPEATLDAVVSAKRLLALGFTTIRDLGSRANIGVTVRDAISRGQIPGPRVVAAGNIITTVGGLLDGHPSHLFDGSRYRYGHGTTISGPWEARDAVRQQVKDGVDWIKTETSGTGFNPMCPADRDTTSEEELAAIVHEASRKARPVAVHAESRLGVLKAAAPACAQLSTASSWTTRALSSCSRRTSPTRRHLPSTSASRTGVGTSESRQPSLSSRKAPETFTSKASAAPGKRRPRSSPDRTPAYPASRKAARLRRPRLTLISPECRRWRQ